MRHEQVVVDTCVLSRYLVEQPSDRAKALARLVGGRTTVISFVAAAEIRFGAAQRGWGSKRTARMEQLLDATEIVWPDPDLVDRYVTMRTWCHRSGHGLGAKHHEADRWVAATALWLDVPLVTDDQIFTGVDGLDVLTAPAA